MSTDNLNDAILALMDAETAKTWESRHWSAEYQQEKREAILAPLRAKVETLAGEARTEATTAREQLDQALDAALYGASDNSRALAREMAWQRIQRRLEAGEDPFTVLHGTRNPVEVEAIASIGPSELTRTSGRSADAWRAELRAAAAQVYPALDAGTFGPLTKAVDDTAPQLAYADAADAVLAGKRGGAVGGHVLNGLNRHGGRVLYDQLLGNV